MELVKKLDRLRHISPTQLEIPFSYFQFGGACIVSYGLDYMYMYTMMDGVVIISGCIYHIHSLKDGSHEHEWDGNA